MHLGKFEILNEVGRGGFGTVYRANDTTLDRIVALKVLHKQYISDQKFIESFKREARSMAKVSHPNVVQIFEVGELDQQIYIAMQYFDGGSLEQKIQAEGPLPLKDAIRMLNQVARGLEAGHKIGLIHRDVKPANILYSQSGYIAISDFGVVKSIEQGSPETTNSFNQFTGSPYYIPPEVWQSKANLSPAADVYSLACVLYEALTGEILFTGETYEHVLTRHVLEEPVFSQSLPGNLAELLTVALAKNPSDRHQTMNDFLMATRAALESKRAISEKTEPSGKSDVINELPKPLAPGEITFDQLVRQAQRRAAPQTRAVEPVQQTPPAPPVIEAKRPVPEPPKKTIEPKIPAKQKVTDSPTPSRSAPQPQSQAQTPAVKPSSSNLKPPVVETQRPAPELPKKPVEQKIPAKQKAEEVPTPARAAPHPQSQAQAPAVKPSSPNLRPVADLPSGVSKKPAPRPVSRTVESDNKDLPATIQQSYNAEKVQASQVPALQTPKKKKVSLPLFIGLGLLAVLSVFLIYRFLILPSQAKPITAIEATQPPAPTTEVVASNYRKQDGMEMVYVAEGTFEMGSDTGDDDEKPVRRIFLDGYWIDKYEVTNAQYARCVSEGDCTEPSSLKSYTRETYFGDGAYANYPVVHVTWYQAQDYCKWSGGDLPTEAQWEKAARGTDSREYPWGNEPPDYSRANYDLSIGDTTAVGSYPPGASPYGAMDLAGNVWEWVRDGFAPYGPYDVYNPIELYNSPYRTIRGGNYFDLPSAIRSAYRFYGEPTLSGYDIGFRCILPPDTTELSATKVDLAALPMDISNLPDVSEPTPTISTSSADIREKDGMERVYVPEGTFEMGSANGFDDEKPVHEVYLDAFYIDKVEVTNAQYEICVNTGQCEAPSDTSSDTRSSYYGNSAYEDYPVIHINWNNARDYCAWAGGRLPTEAEWEKAARGTDDRKYPWGDEIPSCSLVNSFNEATGDRCISDTKPVGSYPKNASPYGALDMAGNVWELVSDWYQWDYYSSSPASNPTGPSSGDVKVLRGGSWYYGWDVLRTVYRGSSPVRNGSDEIGFRCVSPVQ